MVFTRGQNIPSEYESSYISSLQKATGYYPNVKYGQAKYGTFFYGGSQYVYVRERYPFELPNMQDRRSGHMPKRKDKAQPGPSDLQEKVRAAFKKCTVCFNAQPKTGGVEPPDIGPRDREWWYDQAGANWYYNYFIGETWNIFYNGNIPDWCKSRTYGMDHSASFCHSPLGSCTINPRSSFNIGIYISPCYGDTAVSKGCISFDLTQFALSELQEASSVPLTFTIYSYAYYDNAEDHPPVDVIIESMPIGTEAFPTEYSQLSNTQYHIGAFSFEPTYGGYERTQFADTKDFLIAAKNNGDTTVYFVFYSTLPWNPDQNDSVIVYAHESIYEPEIFGGYY